MGELLRSLRDEVGQVLREVRRLRVPRGAVLVVAVGLLATVAAALLSTDKLIGVTTLEWVEEATLPGLQAGRRSPGGGEMQLTEAGIEATECNISGYRLYRVAAVLHIAAGSAVGRARLRCAITVPKRTISHQDPSQPSLLPALQRRTAEQGTIENSAGRVQLARHRSRAGRIRRRARRTLHAT